MRVDPEEKKRKLRTMKQEHKKHSLNSVLNVALLICASAIKQKFSLVAASGVLAVGLISLLVSWIQLWNQLGVCPGFFHSTSCRPELRGEKLRFRSTRVLEIGVFNGLIDSLFWYFFARVESGFFVFSFVGYCFVGFLTDGMRYYLIDALVMLAACFSVFFSLSYEIPKDFYNQAALVLLFGKVLILNRFKSQLKESKSVSIVSIMTQGIVFVIYCFFYLDFGQPDDLILAVVLVLLTYSFVDLADEKKGTYYSILSLLMFAFTQNIEILPIILSALCLFLHLFGMHIVGLFKTRFNIVLKHSNSLKEISTPLI